nr:MAG TPA: hypothetical protein [Caudoviricetes sp.]
MGEIQKIELKGIRVLTTKQIAEAYETTEEKIRWNFKYNRDKYIPGKHYIVIEGEELREMKRECEFHTLFKQAKSVCFWTEKGALMHAKSLNTEKAWQAYEYLVDAYFKDKHENTPKALPEKTTPAIETKKNTIPEMRNPIWIFNVLYQFAKCNKMNVRSLDMKSRCFSILNQNQIGIRTQMKLETVNYELAYELSHAMIHYDAGNIIDSPLRKEYDQQAERAADMLIKLLDNVEQSI